MVREEKQLDRYRIERLLGSGGMGEVYLAQDTLIQRQVAIKMMRIEAVNQEEQENEAARLFLREVKAISMLDHPYILPLYEYGQQQSDGKNMIYLVMPYRAEGSLAQWHKEHTLSPQDIAHFIQQAASALQHAHDHQIIHQDVKPANFLIRARARMRPDLLLADFGIARLTTNTSHASQTVRGTPAYMPPEQWQGNSVPATDQYALAVMAYALLTGRLPFQATPTLPPHSNPGPFQANTQQHTRRRWQIALIGVISLVLLASLLAGINAYQHQAQQTNTQHQQLVKNMTATAIVQATTSTPAFPTYLPGHSTLALNDPLLKQHWYERSLKSWGGSCLLMNDGLHARQILSDPVQAGQTHSGRAITCPARALFKNFAFTIDMTIQQGDCGGIVFRDDTTTGKQYYFRVCQNGTASFMKAGAYYQNSDTLSRPINSTSMHTGLMKSNQLTVLAQGNQHSLYINGTLITTIQDSDFTQGTVGVTAEDINSITEVRYQNARVWTTT